MGTRTTTVNYDPNGNKTYTTTYHRRRVERVILNIIFDAFIAPIIALARTFLAICIHLTVFFVIPVLLSVGIDSLGLRSDKKEFVAGFIATSSAILFTYGGFIFQHAAIPLGLSTSILSAAVSLIAVFTMPAISTYTLGAFAGAGACFGALFHWLYLEPRSETLSHILCHQYGRVATIKAKEQPSKSEQSSMTTIEEVSVTKEEINAHVG
uniref:Scamp family-domain-containing protein n=1 Tax=Panagrellus redivivus TaxID=6233 RepID=A0A7E4VU88_PANRE